MEMKRTHQYFVGQIPSTKLLTLIWLISAAMVIHIALMLVSYITEPDLELFGENSFLEINIASHIMFISIYVLLCIQGMLERDIYQVVLSTLFVSVICILEIVIRLRFALHVQDILPTLSDTIPIFVGFSIISTILFTSELRNDLGWFYYKSYGAGYNTMHGIRMSMLTMFKLNVQVFLSFLYYKHKVLGRLYILISETGLYCILLLLFNLEHRFKNNYFIRFMFLTIVLVLFAYFIVATADNDIVWKPDRVDGLTEIEKDYQRALLILKMVLLFLLSTFTILDTLSFPAYRRLESRDLLNPVRKRMIISSSNTLDYVNIPV